MSTCIYCESDQNLNTSLTITLDDGAKVTVVICDAHAEEASVKSAKASYLARQAKLAEVLEMAKKLGYNLVPSQGTGLIVANAPPPAPAPPPPAVPEAVILEPDDPNYISTRKVDAITTSRRLMSAAGNVVNTADGAIAPQAQLDLTKTKKELGTALVGKVKMELFEGRGGQPVALPTERIDGTGTTTTRIVQTGGDPALQSRFKRMAEASRSENPGIAGPDFRNEYAVADCPVCHGDMVVVNQGQKIPCPKCGGSGLRSGQ